MFEVRAVATKGLGVFATIPIVRGTAILADKPLLQLRADQDDRDLYRAFQSLPTARRADFLSLSGHAARLTSLSRWGLGAWYTLRNLAGSRKFSLPDRETPVRLAEHARVLTIFRTNAFQCDAASFATAVFHRVSRFNHSCVPNTLGIWNEVLGAFAVHATHDIDVGEEITLNYLHDEGAARDVRQAKLGGYGFECACPACDLKSAQGRASESRRVEMRAALGRWMAENAEKGGEITEEGLRGQLAIIEGFTEMFVADGLAGRELAEMYLAAAKLHGELKDYATALSCAEKALVIDGCALGKSHPLFKKDLELIDSLRGFQETLASRRVATQVF